MNYLRFVEGNTIDGNKTSKEPVVGQMGKSITQERKPTTACHCLNLSKVETLGGINCPASIWLKKRKGR